MSVPRHPQDDPGKEQDQRIELLISWLLRVGVAGSMVILLAGIAAMFVHDNPGELHKPAALPALIAPGAAFPHTVPQVIGGFDGFAGKAVMAAGLLVLIATPVLRVAASAVGFACQRDWVYFALTTFVLLVLLVSFLIGRAS